MIDEGLTANVLVRLGASAVLVFAIGCGANPESNPEDIQSSPKVGSSPSQTSPEQGRGNAFVSSVEANVSGPGRVTLVVKGEVPTECHSPKAEATTQGKRVQLEVWSESAEDRVCPPVLKSFETTVVVSEFPAGRYEVILSGDTVATFQI